MSKLIWVIIVVVFFASSCITNQNETINTEEVVGDAEKVDAVTGRLVSDRKFSDLSFDCASQQSSEKAHTGKFSIKLTPKSPYGFTYVVSEVFPGEKFIVSVWRYSEKGKGMLVVLQKETPIYFI
jgi:hypothetical protein